jgi:hypothetical protein
MANNDNSNMVTEDNNATNTDYNNNNMITDDSYPDAVPLFAWPAWKKVPTSEFKPGYYSKCFPTMFPDR